LTLSNPDGSRALQNPMPALIPGRETHATYLAMECRVHIAATFLASSLLYLFVYSTSTHMSGNADFQNNPHTYLLRRKGDLADN
jgi:hypothetical protein